MPEACVLGGCSNIKDEKTDISIHHIPLLTLEALRRGGGGVKLTHPPRFFGFKFLFLDRLAKALAQLFVVCEHIFWH